MIDFSVTNEHLGIIDKYCGFVNCWLVPNHLNYDEGRMNGSKGKEDGGHGQSLLNDALALEELGSNCTGIDICIDANTPAFTPLYVAVFDTLKNKN
ncbi:MAG: hypothetical protein WBK40_10170 [Bacteroidales bacterium]|jgi:hypothetical protein|nr:hypothetical protein [Lentimicrobium sp.]OQC38694.1 MAG: hypothetical protein BWX63_00077 [Bacteroidetes bacterium ADurb.Bin041]HNV50456.1 hypothetical protein [Bacteroidales bacterium]HPW42681.1 hypothetical protein [Bacteroidales bacterium]